MSSMRRRSKFSCNAAIHATAQAAMAAHGTPFDSVRDRNFGAYPACETAIGSRESDRVSELKLPSVLIMAPSSVAIPSHWPPARAAKFTQLPVAHADTGIPIFHTAATGITYETSTPASANNMTRGYVRCGCSTSPAIVEALSHPM